MLVSKTPLAPSATTPAPAGLPRGLRDLADPAWKGRWAAAPAGADFQAIVAAYLALKGDEAAGQWLKAMKTNALAYRGNSAVLRAVNAGEIESGVIYHYYYYADQSKTGENTRNIGMHYFKNQDPGAFISVSGGGVLATSRNKENAQAFLKWVVGKGGQGILRTEDSMEYAISIGEASHPSLPPLHELQAPRLDPAKLDSKRVTELIVQAGLL